MKGQNSQTLLSEIHDLKEQLRLYREYDPLTGLYSKNTFYERTEEFLRRHPESPQDIVCVDIECFKLYNDLYGWKKGDELLKALAHELKTRLPVTGGLIARLSNDVYALCVPHSQGDQMEAPILEIFRGHSEEMAITPAIGVYRDGGRIAASLMCDRAILALGTIKGNYLKHTAVYDSSMRDKLLTERDLLSSAAQGLEERQFKVYMQPKCNMNTGKIVGAEALVRWEHPVKGIISPSEFIPLFERNGFVKQLDLFVWEETAMWLRRWIDAGHRPIPISVNISRIDIFRMDLYAVLEELIERYRLDPQFVELEITESAYVNQSDHIIEALEQLMSHGFTVLMDDFGSGYSSLNMLKDVNVDILKIDMRFLENEDKKSKGILESIVRMSRWLNLPVIAEGVETQSQVNFLTSIGCIYAQGYFYYRPMPLSQFEELLSDGGRIDSEDGCVLRTNQDMLLDFHELFHRDMMSDRMMGNILGAIALYNYDKGALYLLRANEEYMRMVGRKEIDPSANLLLRVLEEDRGSLIEALASAQEDENESGVEVNARIMRGGRPVWIQMHLFHLSKNVGQNIYYASLSDVTVDREAMEALRMSEQRFRIAMEATNIIIFELDIKTREARYSEYAQKAFGLDATVSNAPDGFIEQGTVCGDSEHEFRRIYEEIYAGADRASCVIHAKMGDGSRARNRITLTAVKNESGKNVKAVGMVEMISRE